MHNAHGDVVDVTNGTEYSQEYYFYNAFGTNNYFEDACAPKKWGYCDQLYDFETGNYYMRARYYNPEIGRFISEDPIKDGSNWYTYCYCDPVNYIDTIGLDAILINKETDFTSLVDHMGAFFQDERSYWWFFYWGGDSVKYEKVDDNSIFESLDKINEYLFDKGLNLKEDKPYTKSVYIKGDFTVSHKEALAMKDIYLRNVVKGYRSIWGKNSYYDINDRNCTQVTMELFSMGTLPKGMNVGNYIKDNNVEISMIPNVNMENMQRIFYNNATNSQKYYSDVKNQYLIYKEFNNDMKKAYGKRLSNMKNILGVDKLW